MWDSMTPIQQNNWLAEHVMGWEKRPVKPDFPDDIVWVNKEGDIMYCDCDWQPTSDISAAFEVQEKIKEMDGHIQVGFVSRLYEILDIPFNKLLTTGNALKLIHATPEQRCKAAYLAIGEGKK